MSLPVNHSPVVITIISTLIAALSAAAGHDRISIPSAMVRQQWGEPANTVFTGDELTVTSTATGVILRCSFQRLEGEATSEGLWLTSTVPTPSNNRFRVVATEVGRRTAGTAECLTTAVKLSRTGQIALEKEVVRFTRPGLIEEYSVSANGVRQDFLVNERPSGAGELNVRLAVSGARVLSEDAGVQLALDGSGRRISYGRLHVTDATGQRLGAQIEAVGPNTLVVVVDDREAAYPVRIDPTFSDANWISMGNLPGTDGSVYAAAIDGLGNLYISGIFSVVGTVPANNIAKWDGTNWSSLGMGLNYWPTTLAIFGSELYAGNSKWDGNSWSDVGLNGSVESLALMGGDLYVGGGFTFATNSDGTSIPVNYIAKWDGVTWSAVGGGVNGFVSSMLAVGNELFIGGTFTRTTNSIGLGLTVNRIAKWNGTDWSALGSGLTYPYFPGANEVRALAAIGGDVYAGGAFIKETSGIRATNIARWDGTSWHAVGTGISGGIFALASAGNQLYAGGIFSMVGGVPFNNIAVWDGSDWKALDSGMRGEYGHVYALIAVATNNVFAGGSFTTAGGSAANSIAKWNGSNWSALAPNTSVDSTVEALAVSGDQLYVAGDFTRAGEVATSSTAAWDGSNWKALGAGVGGNHFLYNGAKALAVSGSSVYVGGDFTMAGGVAASYIARWDGTNWQALGGGVNGRVVALAVSGNGLYAGGVFNTATNAGGTSMVVNYIAKWDGTTWSALGSGLNGYVETLAISGNDLYVGGDFTTAGGTPANRIAKWDGNNWSALGTGIENGWPFALAISDTNLFVGGLFKAAGGVAATNIAKWNGTSWSALGPGLIDPDNFYESAVEALLISDDNLYAGGSFTTAGGVPANGIAKWDGTNWSGLGSGTSGRVHALALTGSDLYLGGSFQMAGGRVSAYLARAIIKPGDWLTLRLDSPGPQTNSLTYVGVPNEPYLVQFTTNLAGGPWLPLATNTPAADGRGTVLDPNATNSTRLYRVTSP
jgi:hypothetical protein